MDNLTHCVISEGSRWLTLVVFATGSKFLEAPSCLQCCPNFLCTLQTLAMPTVKLFHLVMMDGRSLWWLECMAGEIAGHARVYQFDFPWKSSPAWLSNSRPWRGWTQIKRRLRSPSHTFRTIKQMYWKENRELALGTRHVIDSSVWY